MTRVLHILDHSLPLHSGYTFRTRAIMKSQIAAGMEVRGLTGPRQGGDAGAHPSDGLRQEDAEGLSFFRAPALPSGPPGIREWHEIESLRRGIEHAAQLWRPDILHAHSPALTGMAGLRAS
ncbi:MAG: glycosyltransferase WbuB, partial [Alphaproteobacteria bacterium]|nr:glycosyltransferase WbuB [Alphaproteobacteria bacterium]